MSELFYRKGSRSAISHLGLVKAATDDKQGLPSWVLPTAAGVGTAALAAPLLYKHFRRFQPSANPALRAIQDVSEQAGEKFTRGVPIERPASKLQRMWDRISHTGSLSDDLVYTERNLPKKPKRVKGVVRLTDPEDKAFVRGDRIVGADPRHEKLTDLIGNSKMEEANFFQKYAPGSMGRSESLKDILTGLGHKTVPSDPEAQRAMLDTLQSHMKQRYPSGFLMKDVAGYRSNGRFPSEEHNLNDLRRQFHEDKLPEMMARVQRGEIPEYEAIPKMTAYPSYSGRVVDQLLKDPSQVMAQEKINIRQPEGWRKWIAETLHNPNSSSYWRRSLHPSNEMRVHVEGGAAIPELTVPRYDPTMHLTDSGTLQRATEFAQNTVNQFPEKYKGMSYAMDVVPTAEGGFKMIESNPGGQSGFLYPDVMPLSGPILRRQLTGRWGDAAAGTMAGAGATALGAGVGAATAAAQPSLHEYLKEKPAKLAPPKSGPVQEEPALTPVPFNQ